MHIAHVHVQYNTLFRVLYLMCTCFSGMTGTRNSIFLSGWIRGLLKAKFAFFVIHVCIHYIGESCLHPSNWQLQKALTTVCLVLMYVHGHHSKDSVMSFVLLLLMAAMVLTK